MAEEPSHVARMLRPADLVVLDALAYGLRDVRADGAPLVEAGEDGGRLEIRLPFQHLQEQAFPEVGPAPSGPPVSIRAAEPSRLVFDVPAGEQITWTTSGILTAMSRLQLRVVPLALPAPEPAYLTAEALGVLVNAMPGLELVRTAAGPVVSRRPGRSDSATSLRRTATALRRARLLAHGPIVAADADTVEHLHSLGLAAVLPPHVIDELLPGTDEPRAPRDDETSIEAPYRLVLSPDRTQGFEHAVDPVVEPGTPGRPDRVELWHTRLRYAVRLPAGTAPPELTVRAVWHRTTPGPPMPGIQSLLPGHRGAIVRQSSDPRITEPRPVRADALHLSSLGARLDLHGTWETKPYTDEQLVAVTSWDHVADLGRDSYVKVVVPGYLFPFGHQASLVTITERKIRPPEQAGGAPQAYLFQRQFIVVDEPVRTYGVDETLLPFHDVRVQPLVTPDLEPPDEEVPEGERVPGPRVEGQPDPPPINVFVPHVAGNTPFVFTLRARDHEMRPVVLRTPLVFVASWYHAPSGETGPVPKAWEPFQTIPGHGQPTAFAVPLEEAPGTTSHGAASFTVAGTPVVVPRVSSVPRLRQAAITVPALQHLAPTASTTDVAYARLYRDHRFGDDNAVPQAVLDVVTGGGALSSVGVQFPTTDRSGGFVSPDLSVKALSRTLGAIGDPGALVGGVDVKTLLQGATPKLFGLVEITDLLAAATDLGAVPEFVSEQFGRAAGFVDDLQALGPALADARARLEAIAAAPTGTTAGPTVATTTAAGVLAGTVAGLIPQVQDGLDEFVEAVGRLVEDPDGAETAVRSALGTLGAALDQLDDVLRDPVVPPLVRARLERLVGGLSAVRGDLTGLLAALTAMARGADELTQLRARYQWQPVLKSWPEGAPLITVAPDSFTLSLEARVAGPDGAAVDIAAELKDFGLNLPPAPNRVVGLAFERLAFRSVSGSKPEVDCVFGGMQWFGPLSFIQTLQDIIPFDGFSDPPTLDVTPEGVTAGYQLALPNAAVGVFSLENIALAADVRVPFLGEAVTVGFAFCSRERPFRLTVMMIGGGGFVGLRLSPRGLVMLEMSLEAGAALSINLGVASGSVSIMLGVYMRLDVQPKGTSVSLTGYLRIRGEVDVLGLISASITLELSLTYVPTTGKLTGRASVIVQIQLLFLSTSVEVSYERQFAGSNDDPTFAQILGVDDGAVPLPGAPDGGVPAWSQYCAAFAPA